MYGRVGCISGNIFWVWRGWTLLGEGSTATGGGVVFVFRDATHVWMEGRFGLTPLFATMGIQTREYVRFLLCVNLTLPLGLPRPENVPSTVYTCDRAKVQPSVPIMTSGLLEGDPSIIFAHSISFRRRFSRSGVSQPRDRAREPSGRLLGKAELVVPGA